MCVQSLLGSVSVLNSQYVCPVSTGLSVGAEFTVCVSSLYWAQCRCLIHSMCVQSLLGSVSVLNSQYVCPVSTGLSVGAEFTVCVSSLYWAQCRC